MSNIFSSLAKLGIINEWIGRATAWLAVAMVFVTVYIVVARYGFDSGSIAVQESVIYMHAAVFLLGAAYTLQHDEHVRVDIFYQKFGPKGRAWVNIFGTLFLLLPVCVFIWYSSWDYVTESWRVNESSGEAGGLPGVYLLKTMILAFAALMILQALAVLGKSAATITNSEAN